MTAASIAGDPAATASPIPAVDRGTPIPLHYQISESLRARIEQGCFKPGELLPPEKLLAVELGVSRSTMRQALATLTRQGLLSRRAGVGTVVAPRNLEQPLRGLYSFQGLAEASGQTLTTRVLAARLTAPSDEAAEALHLRTAGDRVLQLRRLRILGGAPIALELIVLPATRCAALAGRPDLDRPLYELLRDRCAIDVTAASERIRPGVLSARQAALLGRRRGTPAFRVDRIGYAEGEPVEWRRSVVPGDRYLYSIDLVRGAGRAAPTSPEPARGGSA